MKDLRQIFEVACSFCATVYNLRPGEYAICSSDTCKAHRRAEICYVAVTHQGEQVLGCTMRALINKGFQIE